MARVTWNNAAGRAIVDREGGKLMTERGRAVINAAKAGIRASSGMGKTLGSKKKREKGRPHSAPGAFPAYQTGLFYKSFKIKKAGRNRWRITNTDPVSHLLELGTKKIRARPFFKNALRAVFGASVVLSFEQKERNP